MFPLYRVLLMLLTLLAAFQQGFVPAQGRIGAPSPGPAFAPAPCSSDLYHREGKCGGASHAYLRCGQGYWCSQFGFCGTASEYQKNPTCLQETRQDPPVRQYGTAPDDPAVPAPGPAAQAPCASEQYSLLGKCGGADHAYLRCPNGYWCSQAGFCGTSAGYRDGAVCDREERADSATDTDIQYGFSPDDQPSDYEPQDETEAEMFDAGKTNYNCRTDKLHRWAKCGTLGHGNFRCKFGEWCSQGGFCGNQAGVAENALCPKETRPNPAVIQYAPAPDDDPEWDPEPTPCSTDKFSLMGKCGGPDQAYLRCPKGNWCSQFGFCGSAPEYRSNALCDQEQRDDPDVDNVQYGFASDDKPRDYEIQDDAEAEKFDEGKNLTNCRTEALHRWGKCGTAGHGHYRCKFGYWCTRFGFCSMFKGAADGALCPKETRQNPEPITYVPAPDDDPDYAH